VRFFKNSAKRIPVLREVIRIHSRRKRAIGPSKERLKLAKRWSFKHTEFSNYYYDITERNKKDLAFIISHITHTPVVKINEFFEEIGSDQEVEKILMDFRDSQPGLRDSTMKIARRIGWYTFVRVTKPRWVVETGVHHGVGALVICAALSKNYEEGFEGSYLGTDINPLAGQLLRDPFKQFGSVIIGDSLETLQKIDFEIDIFINDSDHTKNYEAREYASIRAKLSQKGIILGDNCEETDELRVFSQKNGRDFIYFKEEPYNHFYTGGGIGISYTPKELLKNLSGLRD
jgi:hypothetical protein